MITSNRHQLFCKLFLPFMRWRMSRGFKALKLCDEIELKPDYSVLLLCNHFSWWDGFLAGYISHFVLGKKVFTMIQEDHLRQRLWLRKLGCFSINQTSRDMLKSIQYAAVQLDNSENAVNLFPQGSLQSNHSFEIKIEKGVGHIVKSIKGNCQIVYCTILIDYFESFKPTAYFYLLDCGTNHNLDVRQLSEKINGFHQKALQTQGNVIPKNNR